MKILTLITLFITTISYGQFCNTSSLNNQGALTVTNTAQTTPVINANGTRLYYTFDVEPGCIYTFETCGLTTIDTYIRIYNGTNPATSTLLWQNDDACGVQSRVSFGVTAAGTYSVLITRYIFLGGNCNNLNNNNISVRYRKDCEHTNQDCFGSTQICNDQTFTGNNNNFGDWQELNASNRGCLLGNEHQSSWYYFIPTVNGIISMTIQTTVDYDFAIWEGTNCVNLGSPIRCSFSGTPGNTGLGNGATDLSEGFGGNGWVAPLNVTAGVFYIMVIDNFDADNTPFTIDFTFSTPNLLDCTPTPLPIELISFLGENIENENILNWVTASEHNNYKFRIENSIDLINWNTIGYVQGNNYPSMYEFIDNDYRNTVNYYRLVQIDFNGTENYHDIISIDNTQTSKNIIGVYNILGQPVSLNTKGVVIIRYSDNSFIKILND
jgi:hypothetical protein